MNILVTGAAGFIGFHLSRRLMAEGHRVVGVDNFTDYYPVCLKRARFALLQAQPGFVGLEQDLCDVEALKRLMLNERFARVCHLAAQPGVRYSITHPFAYEESNLRAFLNVLEAGRAVGLSRLVYASSSSVYGGNKSLPFRETDSVDRPISLYAATKKANELMAHVYSHLYGIQMIGLRLFTVYGPWGRPDMAVWSFTESMLKGQPIKVFNHGRMRRDFTYVDDIVAGIMAALFKDGLAPYEVFNIGNHRAELLMDMIDILARALGVEPKMELLPLQPGDVEETYADIDAARMRLGFNPVTAIAEGLPRFTEWYRQYHAL